MSGLANILEKHAERDVIKFPEGCVRGSAILQRADILERAMVAPKGRLILSLDSSPASLLALLVVAERSECFIMLGRESIDTDALERKLRPDWIVRNPERIERTATEHGPQSHGGTGIFLLTSGTAGVPKVVHQTLDGLLGRVLTRSISRNLNARWLQTYETHSFAGLQVVLSAVFCEGLLVMPESRTPAALAATARTDEATHISGTPTLWRSLLLAIGTTGLPALRQITMGGEAVDQPTLDRLAQRFPSARISHIYASTEAGSLFAVHDGRAGFPKEWLHIELPGGVRLRVRDDILEALSPRRMLSYVSGQLLPLSPDGWLVTGDTVRVTEDRCFFAGRQDHIVNIAGLKVSPLQVEEVLLAQPSVVEAQVYAIASPITGSILGARVVLLPGLEKEATLKELRVACVRLLPRHSQPRKFDAVDSIVISSAGKKVHG